MIQRLYINNFRCLENFELPIKNIASALLIGKNGSGKSTIGKVLELLQCISRGQNRMRDLEKRNMVGRKDFAPGKSEVPIRFEIEALLANHLYKYVLALELPEKFKELRVFEEQLSVSGNPIYSRDRDQVTLYGASGDSAAGDHSKFLVNWHLAALPILQNQSDTDPLQIFRIWLSRMIILDPVPGRMTGDSAEELLEPKRDGSNFGDWFSGVLSRYPAAYTQIEKYIRNVMPDIQDVVNESVGKDAKNMRVRFEGDKGSISIDFKDLSDGEKCFFLCALVLAANRSYGPLFCFWDEPDNYLSLSEIGHFVTALRSAFRNSGQFLATSHNYETIRKFSTDNTFVLDRKSHMEPALIRPLRDLPVGEDLEDTLIREGISL